MIYTLNSSGLFIIFQLFNVFSACIAGHVLIIDEADKAPTHVTSTLRSLLESRHIRLPDGRVISDDPKAGKLPDIKDVRLV